ncbi:hypothetical protein [Pseudonocardia charpentierae]|uniref:PhiRv1 phage protein n=1 Tax=Pseudonocardia charpentierae TaxID=3075545 RepID=A0ABU2NM55_9PSEU|nr:hypothetical protein [Pseudonocardia sp. DSM 45834]MDT0353724.1 hypothetical protein [Pseudonocardia sp. DSM 45834]
MSPETLAARGKLARLTRDHGPGAEAVITARRTFDAERLADHIRAVVDAAPPLTPAQRDRLAALLRCGAA